MDLGLAGKTAIVTGASRGVGRSIVQLGTTASVEYHHFPGAGFTQRVAY